MKVSYRVKDIHVSESLPRTKLRLGFDKARDKKNTEGRRGPVVLALPQPLPSVHEVSSDEEVSVHAVFTDDTSSHYVKSSSLSALTNATDTQADSSSSQAHPHSELPVEPDITSDSSSPHTSINSGSSVFSHSSTLTSVRRSLKRFTSRTKGNFFTSTNPRRGVPRGFQTPSTSNEAQSSTDASHILPELSFDTSPLSVLIHEEQDIKDSLPEDQEPEISLIESVQAPAPAPDIPIPLIRYEFVDPQELTASPAVTLGASYSLSGVSLQSPSPSWLSRNVGSFELPTSVEPERPSLQINPPSPDPLPILPRGYLEASFRQPNSSEVSTALTHLFARYF